MSDSGRGISLDGTRVGWQVLPSDIYSLIACTKLSPKHFYEEVPYRLERAVLAGPSKEDGFSTLRACGRRKYAVLVVDSHIAVRLPQAVTKMPKGKSVRGYQKCGESLLQACGVWGPFTDTRDRTEKYENI